MKKLILLLFIQFTLIRLNAQVKIGAPGNPDVNAVLELAGTSKGLLLPRLSLTGTASPAPLSAFTAGMIVYNTALIADVRPGYYFSDGTKWLRIFSATDGWSLSGNTGTNNVTNYIGTTDSVGLTIRTFNNDRINISPTGSVGIGVFLPPPTRRLIIGGSSSGNTAANLGLVGQLNATADGQTLSSIYNVPSFGNSFIPTNVYGNYTELLYSQQAVSITGTWSEVFTSGANRYTGIIAGVRGSVIRNSTGNNESEYYGGYFSANASDPGSGRVNGFYSIRGLSNISGTLTSHMDNFGGFNNMVSVSNINATINTMYGIRNHLSSQSPVEVAIGLRNTINGLTGSQYNSVYGTYTEISAGPGSSMTAAYAHAIEQVGAGTPISNYWGIHIGNIGLTSGTRRVFEYAGTGTNDPVIINYDGSVQIGTDIPVTNAKLSIVDGHLQSGQTTKPSISAHPINIGAGAVATLNDATDVAGIISIDPGTPPFLAGIAVTITFNKPFAIPPIVVITPTNENAAEAIVNQQPYINTTTTGFSIRFTLPVNSTVVMTFSYHVIETVNN